MPGVSYYQGSVRGSGFTPSGQRELFRMMELFCGIIVMVASSIKLMKRGERNGGKVSLY